MDSKWTGLRMDSNWTQNGLRMDSKWTQNGLRMDSKWTQNGLKMDSELRLASSYMVMFAISVLPWENTVKVNIYI